MPAPPIRNQPRPADSFVPKVNLVMDLVSVKVIFTLHFVLIALALALLSWMPSIFLYYNTFFFVCLFWSSHTKERNPEPIILAAIINATSIALDIICIVTTYEEFNNLIIYHRRLPASLVFLIINLVMRPFTTFILARLYFFKNRFDLQSNPHSGIANGSSSLSSAIRKILFLNSEAGEMNHTNVDASGTYRAHRNVEQKNSAPLTAVLSVPSQQHQSQTRVQPQEVQVQHLSEAPSPRVEAQPVSQQSPPQPQPRQSQQNRQSTYTDPDTGETYQERMI